MRYYKLGLKMYIKIDISSVGTMININRPRVHAFPSGATYIRTLKLFKGCWSWTNKRG